MGQETYSLIQPLLERRGIRPSAAQQSHIERYAELVRHWNRGVNLVGDVERLYSRHILDCLMLETLPWPGGPQEILDAGSGAALPGMLMAIMHPRCHVVSLDTVAKKVTFQQMAAGALKLDNFEPRRQNVHRLAAEPEGRGAFGLVLVRALADLDTLLGLAADLLRPGGELWAMKGRKLAAEQAALRPETLERFEPGCATYPYEFSEVNTGGVIAVYRKREEPATGGR